MINLKKLWVASFLLLFLNSALANSIIKIAYVDFPPYEYKNKNQPQGILVEIIKKIFHECSIEFTLIHLPFSRALLDLKKGNIDALFNLYKNEERTAFVDFTDPVIQNPLVFFVKKNSQLQYTHMENLKGLTIGTMLGYTYGKEFDESTIFTKAAINSHSSNLKKLILGRIDAYLVDRLVGLYTAKEEKISDKIKILPVPLKIMEGRIGFTKNKHAEIIKKINIVIQKMKSNGEIDQIIDNYVKSFALDSNSATN